MAGRDKGARQDSDISKGSWIAFLLLVLGAGWSAISVIYSTHESRQLLNELQQLKNKRNDLQAEWGRLLLEQSSMVSQGRIEAIAIEELGMEVPAMKDVVVIKSD
ncbi:MAG: cell division protein FtsL [Pseudomonadales bacterium]|nr:cell division protein FtsL [Pseudomonadales bacterium]